jgi:sec-independent protein translocase protein TatB
MFDLSWSHIAILVVVALLVLGPKELPNAIRTGAQLLRTLRKLAGEFRSGMDDLLREAELDETRKAIKQAMTEGVENTIAQNVDPTGEIKAAVSTNPLTESEAIPAAETPKVIEHDAPPAPAHSIVPPPSERPIEAAAEASLASPAAAEPTAAHVAEPREQKRDASA